MDPLSFTASLIGVANFAGTVVTKLYTYCKAVKDCEEDVIKLRLELDVFTAVIDRLAQVIGDENENENVDKGEDNEALAQTPAIPPYLVACQSVLYEIDNTLVSFERKASKPHSSHPKMRRFTGNIFRNLSKSDLKWPLSKPKTLEIIARLERYKGTCILALAADEISSVQRIFDDTKLMSEDLAEVKTDTKKLKEAQIDKEVGEIFYWFCPVNPRLKHQEFRKEYQSGTCLWIFDRPEYQKWFDMPNSALWIHAIPGAGKTILASQIIETLSAKRPRGLAYYYCRYNDSESQRPRFILGSLVSQLARQDKQALDEVRAFYSKYHPSDGLSGVPTEGDLGDLIVKVSRVFDEVTLVVDGLDEVGSAIVLDRTQLVQTLSSLHKATNTIRTIILSRAEPDLQLNLTGIDDISIAATSGDLMLYVSAKMSLLNIKNHSLKSEVLEALINRAEGMFYWTVCQIQLLKDLPTPISMRKALENLPPGLPATYVRIFETMDARYPIQTQRLIQRVLRWLVFQKKRLSLEALCHAISIDEGATSLNLNAIPDENDLCRWLGCLTRRTATGSLELAHFSIEEFLRSSSSNFTSTVTSKYLLKEAESSILADVCFSYLSFTDFSCVEFDLFDDEAREAFDQKFPFYNHAAYMVPQYIQIDTQYQEPTSCCRLFEVSASQQFLFWISYATSEYMINYLCSDKDEWTTAQRHGKINNVTSPLDVACKLLLASTVSRLISEGADPNQRLVNQTTPFCSALSKKSEHIDVFEHPNLYYSQEYKNEGPAISHILRDLIAGGGDVNATSPCYEFEVNQSCWYSPLYMALYQQHFEAARLLLDNGAIVICDQSSLYELLQDILESTSKDCYWEWNETFSRVLESDYEAEFRSIIETFLRRDMNLDTDADSDNADSRSLKNGTTEFTEGLFVSLGCNDIFGVQFYVSGGAELDALNDDGQCALTLAIESNHPEFAEHLRESGASLHTIESDGITPLISAFRSKKFSIVHEFVGNLENLKFSDHEYQQIFTFARDTGNLELLKYIVQAVAKDRGPSMVRSILSTEEEEEEKKRRLNNVEVLEILSPFGLLSDWEQHYLFRSMCNGERMHLIRNFLQQNSDFDVSENYLFNTDVDKQNDLWYKCGRFCFLCWAGAEASLDAFEALFKRVGATCTTHQHITHLCIAASRWHGGITDFILKYVRDPNQPDSDGLNAILHAARGSQLMCKSHPKLNLAAGDRDEAGA